MNCFYIISRYNFSVKSLEVDSGAYMYKNHEFTVK